MELTNLNYITFVIFILLFLWIAYLSYKFYLKSIIFNKIYKLLANNSFFYFKYLFLVISFIILLFSIFWLKIWEKQTKNEAKWVDIMFVLDVSKSMNVADIEDNNYTYTRLDIMKKSISNFVVKHENDRFWLVIFAWDAVSTVPLTTDHDIFLTFLENVDYRNLTVQWSNFEKAISLWVDRFTSLDNNRSKIVAFVSDGWDEEDSVDSDSISSISKKVKWINYFVVWVWTKDWWKIINWRDPFGRVNYQQYNSDYVISKLNENNLNKIKNALNWEYLEVSKIDDLLNLDKYINKLEKKALETDINGEKADWWRALAIISFIFFIIFLLFYISPYPNLSPNGRKEYKNIS